MTKNITKTLFYISIVLSTKLLLLLEKILEIVYNCKNTYELKNALFFLQLILYLNMSLIRYYRVLRHLTFYFKVYTYL